MFEESLRRLVENVEGGLACVVMGFDGISLEKYLSPEPGAFDVETIGMEYSVVLRQIRNTAGLLDAGDLGEVAIRNEKVTAILRPISNEYFLLFAMKPDGNFGKGRYMARLVAPEIRRELA